MKTSVRVWDPLVRLFHWSLVVAFVVAYLSGEEEDDLHIYAGYVVMGLIIFRLLWGIIGSKYARFSEFVYSPAAVLAYIKSLTAKPKHYMGHNPAAGWMIVALLLTLIVVTYSGLKVYAIEEGLGPLAVQAPEGLLISTAYADDDRHRHDGYSERNEEYKDEDYDERYDGKDEEDEDEENGAKEDGDEDDEEFWEEIHEASSNFMLLLIVLHIAGVLIAGRIHKENLVKAMITGNKVKQLE